MLLFICFIFTSLTHHFHILVKLLIKKAQDEIKWVIIAALSSFINQTGYQVSHVLTDEKFKSFAIIQENNCLGISKMIISDGIDFEIINDENEF